MIDHPEFSSNPVYVAGDSYSGMIVPVLAQKMSNGMQIHTLIYIYNKMDRGIFLDGNQIMKNVSVDIYFFILLFCCHAENEAGIKRPINLQVH